MWRNKLILLIIVVIIEIIVVEGSNRTVYQKHVNKRLTAKTLKKDFKTLKKQDGAVKLVDGDRGIFEGIFSLLFLIIIF